MIGQYVCACGVFSLRTNPAQKRCRPCQLEHRRTAKERIGQSVPPAPTACAHCATVFVPAMHTSALYCCATCKNTAYLKRKDPLHGMRRAISAQARATAEQSRRAEIAAHRLAVAEAKTAARRRPIACARCGVLWCRLPVVGNRFAYCTECVGAVARDVKATSRAIGKARKRAATVERVSPYRVFERDGWRCYLCRCDTPKHKRGTYDDDAPELEHVIPLAQGGEHSYANTRCACRSCNLLKGALTPGQAFGLACAA
jgi:5-methylcytosine-specific restriction endonuclease McrA